MGGKGRCECHKIGILTHTHTYHATQSQLCINRHISSWNDNLIQSTLKSTGITGCSCSPQAAHLKAALAHLTSPLRVPPMSLCQGHQQNLRTQLVTVTLKHHSLPWLRFSKECKQLPVPSPKLMKALHLNIRDYFVSPPLHTFSGCKPKTVYNMLMHYSNLFNVSLVMLNNQEKTPEPSEVISFVILMTGYSMANILDASTQNA